MARGDADGQPTAVQAAPSASAADAAPDSRTFETPYGPIVLCGRPEAFRGDRPLVVAIAGAFAIARGPLFHLAPHLPNAEVVTGHLPGNHCPPLVATSVGVFAAAYSHVVATAFANRPVIACGASIGGLVAMGLKAPQIRAGLLMEPPLVMNKLWPMWPMLRRRLTEHRGDTELRRFIFNVFGVTEEGVEDRRFAGLLDTLTTPTQVLVGERPLFPERSFDKLPSLVDEPERALMAAHPKIRLSVMQGAGHNVPQEAAHGFVTCLRATVDAAVGPAG